MKDQLQLFRMWKQQTKMSCYQCGNNKLWTNLYHLNDKEWRRNASWVIPPYCTWHSQNWNLNSLFRSFCNKVSTKFVFFYYFNLKVMKVITNILKKWKDCQLKIFRLCKVCIATKVPFLSLFLNQVTW